MFEATTVSSKEELEDILSIQKDNLSGNLSYEEIQTEGFVTLMNNMEILEQLHTLSPSIIIRHDEEIAGYALVMPSQARYLVPSLEPVFQLLENLWYKNRLIKDYRYYVMGQVCIAKPFRGKGLFDVLYNKHRKHFEQSYDL